MQAWCVRYTLFLLQALLLLLLVDAHGGPRYNGLNADRGHFRASWVIYELDEVEYVNFTLKVQVQGWLAIGFSSSDKALEGDAILAYQPSSVTDCFGVFASNLTEDIHLANGTNDITDTSFQYADGFTVVAFSRKLDTGDVYDYNFESDGDVVINWAYGPMDGSQLKDATASGNVQMNFFVGAETEDEYSKLKAHGIIMTLVVMVLLTSGVALSRYLKTVFGYWFYVHTAVFSLALLLIMISTIIIFNAHDNKFEPSWHSAFGLMFIIAMGIQAVLGLTSHLLFDSKRVAPPLFPDVIHWWLGRSAFVIGIIAVSLGLAALGARMLAWNSFLLWGVVCFFLVIAMERYVGQTHEVYAKGIAEDDEAFADAHDDDDVGVGTSYSPPKKGRSLSVADKRPINRPMMKRVLGLGFSGIFALFIFVAAGISTSTVEDDM